MGHSDEDVKGGGILTRLTLEIVNKTRPHQEGLKPRAEAQRAYGA